MWGGKVTSHIMAYVDTVPCGSTDYTARKQTSKVGVERKDMESTL